MKPDAPTDSFSTLFDLYVQEDGFGPEKVDTARKEIASVLTAKGVSVGENQIEFPNLEAEGRELATFDGYKLIVEIIFPNTEKSTEKIEELKAIVTQSGVFTNPQMICDESSFVVQECSNESGVDIKDKFSDLIDTLKDYAPDFDEDEVDKYFKCTNVIKKIDDDNIDEIKKNEGLLGFFGISFKDQADCKKVPGNDNSKNHCGVCGLTFKGGRAIANYCRYTCGKCPSYRA